MTTNEGSHHAAQAPGQDSGRSAEVNSSVWAASAAPYVPLAPLAEDIDADVAIIGGGFTGVSTAWHLARRFPEKRIVLLEARVLAHGASGRNGGLVLNWVNGVDGHDLEDSQRIYGATCEGIDLIESMIKENGLNVPFRRNGCVDVITDPRRAEAAALEVERLRTVGIPVRFLAGAELAARVRLAGACGGIFDPRAGQINGLELVRQMRPVLTGLGVSIFESTPVQRIEEGATITLRTPGGIVHAKAIVLATNAETPRLGYFKDGILPLHSHVIATDPLPPEAWDRIGWRDASGFSDDLNRIAYASMTARGELVFGGGSNAAYDYRFGGATRSPAQADHAYAAVHKQLVKYFPEAADVRIAHRWSGMVGITMSRVCTMGVQGEHRNVYYAIGYSGHGVTLANLAGKVLCDIYSGDDERWRKLPFYQQRLLYIPPEPFRWIGYQVYTRLTGKSPRRPL